MALVAGELATGGEIRDNDGRLIVVGPGGTPISGGGGGAGADPLSDGTPGGALPSKTLWVAGADGTVLRGIAVNASGHVLTAVQNFPATQAVSDGGGSLTVDGTVTANAGTGPWPVTDNGGTLSVDDGAGSLTVDGSVSVSNFPATQPVSGSVNVGNFPASQPVTGPLTDTQLRASAVPVSGTFFQATQPVSGTVAVSNFPATQAVSGTVTDNQGAANASQNNAWWTRPRKLATYKAVFRTATRPYTPSFVFTANTRKQYATIHHAATATKTCRLRSVKVFFESTTVAAFLHADLVRITTAPATGNPAITPGIADSADAAAEATCLTLPTTAGTEGALYSTVKYSPSATAAQATAYPQPPAPWQELLDVAMYDDERKPPVIRAGVLEGWAVVLDVNVAATVIAGVQIEWTEE